MRSFQILKYIFKKKIGPANRTVIISNITLFPQKPTLFVFLANNLELHPKTLQLKTEKLFWKWQSKWNPNPTRSERYLRLEANLLSLSWTPASLSWDEFKDNCGWALLVQDSGFLHLTNIKVASIFILCPACALMVGPYSDSSELSYTTTTSS